MLSRQIENGAPFDVFLSANESFVMDLVAKGKILKEDVQIYANGRLGLWSKSGQFKSFEDFRRFGQVKLAIANPEHAPYGLAARQALEKSGWWATLRPNVVLAENVRQALQFAQSGNVDAAITAWSLVYDSDGQLVPGELHAPIRQVGAEIRKSKQRKLARKFIDFLISPQGRELLAANGLFFSTYTPTLQRP